MKYCITFFTLLSICLYSRAQIAIDTCTLHFFDEFTNSQNDIKVYKIINNSEDDYVTFVSCNFTNSVSNTEAIHRFFNRQIGDFSLSLLVYENLLTSALINRIGTSFMKKIRSKDTFEYHITKKESDSDFYEKRIFVIPLKEIENYLQTTIPDECFPSINALPLYDTINWRRFLDKPSNHRNAK